MPGTLVQSLVVVVSMQRVLQKQQIHSNGIWEVTTEVKKMNYNKSKRKKVCTQYHCRLKSDSEEPGLD